MSHQVCASQAFSLRELLQILGQLCSSLFNCHRLVCNVCQQIEFLHLVLLLEDLLNSFVMGRLESKVVIHKNIEGEDYRGFQVSVLNWQTPCNFIH